MFGVLFFLGGARREYYDVSVQEKKPAWLHLGLEVVYGIVTSRGVFG